MVNVIVVTGQTATGKTNLAIKLAGKHNGELVSCDSRQIYKHLDIITGKDITKNNFKLVKKIDKFDIGYYQVSTKLWLYDIVNPKQYFSSFDYVQCANIVIKNILKRGKTPIIIGGTGLYLKHLLFGFDNTVMPNWKLRKKLENKSVCELQIILKQLDNGTLKQLNNSDINNPRRLIRKIELLSSPHHQKQPVIKNNIKSYKIIGLKYKRKVDLIKVIRSRVEKRLKQGAIDEVKELLAGYKETDPGLKTIGCQQIIQYLRGNLTIDEAVEQWINKEVQYAKRQLTYINKYFQPEWKEI